MGTIWSYWCRAAIIRSTYDPHHYGLATRLYIVDSFLLMWSQRGASLPGAWLVALHCHISYFSSNWCIQDVSLNCVICGILFLHSSTVFSITVARAKANVALSVTLRSRNGLWVEIEMYPDQSFVFLCNRECIFNETIVDETANWVISWAVLKYWHQWVHFFGCI